MEEGKREEKSDIEKVGKGRIRQERGEMQENSAGDAMRKRSLWMRKRYVQRVGQRSVGWGKVSGRGWG